MMQLGHFNIGVIIQVAFTLMHTSVSITINITIGLIGNIDLIMMWYVLRVHIKDKSGITLPSAQKVPGIVYLNEMVESN